MKKRIAAVLLLSVALSLCACAKTEPTPTNAPTEVQTTTEEPKKTLTADEVVALVRDGFDTEKDDCMFEEKTSGESVTVFSDGTTSTEASGETRTAFKKENGRISFRLDIDTQTNGKPFRFIQAYKTGWLGVIDSDGYSVWREPDDIVDDNLAGFRTILDGYISCDITVDGDNTVYTFLLATEDSEETRSYVMDEALVLEKVLSEKNVVTLNKNNELVSCVSTVVREKTSNGKTQTATSVMVAEWSFDNFEINFDDLSDRIDLETGEWKKKG